MHGAIQRLGVNRDTALQVDEYAAALTVPAALALAAPAQAETLMSNIEFADGNYS